jgi:hypothetical protein
MDQPSPAIDPEIDLMISLIQMLSPERRREVISAAAHNRFIDILEACQTKTLGELVRTLEADAHWPLLQQMNVSDAISTGGDEAARAVEGAAVARVAARLPAEAAPAADKRHLAVVKPAEPPKPPKPAAKSEKRTGDIFDEIIDLLRQKPGLRSEQIQKLLAKPKLLIGPSLAALRKAKRVRTEGENRAMRYFAR